MKKIITLSSALTLSLSAWAFIDAPYSVSPEVETIYEFETSWFEVYEVAPTEIGAAIAGLKQDTLPKPLGVGMRNELHMSLNGRPIRLSEVSAVFSRSGQPIEYDAGCVESPRRGDAFIGRYQAGGVSATLQARVHSHELLGEPNPLTNAWTVLPAADPSTCSSIVMEHLFLEGTLTVELQGQGKRQFPVLIQSITSNE